MLLFTFVCTKLTTLSETVKYSCKTSFGFGFTRSDGDPRWSFNSLKTTSRSSISRKFLHPFNMLKNLWHLFEDREMNRVKVVTLPFSFMISLILAFIPLYVTTWPRNNTAATPKVHLFGFILILYLFIMLKVCFMCFRWSSDLFD